MLFSNQLGAKVDRFVSVFRNQTNHISLQGNKIIANATSDDSLTFLDFNPSNNIQTTNLTIGDSTVPATGTIFSEIHEIEIIRLVLEIAKAFGNLETKAFDV